MDDKQAKAPPIGTGHAAAMARLGLRELRAAFYPDLNVAQSHAELGLYGTATPAEVTEVRRGEAPGRDAEAEPPSALGARLQQAAEREPQEPEPPALERE